MNVVVEEFTGTEYKTKLGNGVGRDKANPPKVIDIRAISFVAWS